MAEQGFEYVPRPATPQSIQGTVLGAGLTPLEFAQRYGLGITVTLGLALQEGVGEEQDLESSTDPNLAHVQSLGTAERASWIRALEGEPNAESDDATPGCLARSLGRQQAIESVIDELEDEIGRFRELIDVDARVVAAERDWGRCMRDLGYEVQSPRAMRDQFFAEFLPLRAELLQSLSLLGGDGGGVGETQTLDDLDSTQRDRLANLQRREVEIALANVECTGAVSATRRMVAAELEEQLVRENSALFEAIEPVG